MKTSVNFYSFREAFRNYDRLDNFPNDGLSVLFDWLKDYENNTNEELELDVIAFCCDFQQMPYEDIAREYNIEIDYSEIEVEYHRQHLKDSVMNYLTDSTCVVGECCEGTEVVFQSF